MKDDGLDDIKSSKLYDKMIILSLKISKTNLS